MRGHAVGAARVLAAGAFALGAAACEGRARAQAAPVLTVTRTSDAQDCPDTAGLADRVAAIRGADAKARAAASGPAGASDAAGAALRVAFGRAGEAYFAAIRDGQQPGSVRRLELPGTTCAGLARATAVTVALLLDTDAAAEEPPKPPPPPPPPPAPPPVETRAPATREPRAIALALGGSALVAGVGALAPAVTGEVGLEVGAWRTALGVLVVATQSFTLGPGLVSQSLHAASARVCYAPWRAGAWRSDVCTGAYLGVEGADAEGYTVNDHQTRPWLAVPLELTLSVRQSRVRWELAGGALLGVLRQDFSVRNVGDAYRAPFLGCLVSLRAAALVPW
jgi:hypothetical protein